MGHATDVAGAGDFPPAAHFRCALNGVWRALALVLAIGLAAAPAAAGELDDFFAQHRCPIIERMSAIAYWSKEGLPDAFIAVAMADEEQSYVQCMLLEGDHFWGCEASSGFYGPHDAGGAQMFGLSSAAVAALREIGFQGDGSDGNYWQEVMLPQGSGPARVADLMLIALHRAYGATPASRLEITAPLADWEEADAQCAPAS
jgi:hypothetical protein